MAFDVKGWITALGSVVTAGSVFVAALQLIDSRRLALSRFEDSLTQQYRDLAAQLPLEALFGEEVDRWNLVYALPVFYRYFDLCNEQAFLRQRHRISTETWCQWGDGIRTNMTRPAFQEAWREVKLRAPSDFNELRRLEQSGYREDPNDWHEESAGPNVPASSVYSRGPWESDKAA